MNTKNIFCQFWNFVFVFVKLANCAMYGIFRLKMNRAANFRDFFFVHCCQKKKEEKKWIETSSGIFGRLFNRKCLIKHFIMKIEFSSFSNHISWKFGYFKNDLPFQFHCLGSKRKITKYRSSARGELNQIFIWHFRTYWIVEKCCCRVLGTQFLRFSFTNLTFRSEVCFADFSSQKCNYSFNLPSNLNRKPFNFVRFGAINSFIKFFPHFQSYFSCNFYR